MILFIQIPPYLKAKESFPFLDNDHNDFVDNVDKNDINNENNDIEGPQRPQRPFKNGFLATRGRFSDLVFSTFP